jgi:hypothetical protein
MRVAFIAAALGGLVLGTAGYAHALKSGLDLLRECEGRVEPVKVIGEIACASYLQGVIDTYGFLSSMLRPEAKNTCLPERGIQVEQFMLIVVRWLNAHPSDLHRPARLLALVALRDAFPC